MYQSLYNLICLTYASLIRPLLKRAVDNPDEDWDDILMQLVDGLFNFKETV